MDDNPKKRKLILKLLCSILFASSILSLSAIPAAAQGNPGCGLYRASSVWVNFDVYDGPDGLGDYTLNRSANGPAAFMGLGAAPPCVINLAYIDIFSEVLTNAMVPFQTAPDYSDALTIGLDIVTPTAIWAHATDSGAHRPQVTDLIYLVGNYSGVFFPALAAVAVGPNGPKLQTVAAVYVVVGVWHFQVSPDPYTGVPSTPPYDPGPPLCGFFEDPFCPNTGNPNENLAVMGGVNSQQTTSLKRLMSSTNAEFDIPALSGVFALIPVHTEFIPADSLTGTNASILQIPEMINVELIHGPNKSVQITFGKTKNGAFVPDMKSLIVYPKEGVTVLIDNVARTVTPTAIPATQWVVADEFTSSAMVATAGPSAAPPAAQLKQSRNDSEKLAFPSDYKVVTSDEGIPLGFQQVQ